MKRLIKTKTDSEFLRSIVLNDSCGPDSAATDRLYGIADELEDAEAEEGTWLLAYRNGVRLMLQIDAVDPSEISSPIADHLRDVLDAIWTQLSADERDALIKDARPQPPRVRTASTGVPSAPTTPAPLPRFLFRAQSSKDRK